MCEKSLLKKHRDPRSLEDEDLYHCTLEKWPHSEVISANVTGSFQL